MSDIRPFMSLDPAVRPAAAPSTGVREAQAAFFRQALAQVEAVQQVATQPTARTTLAEPSRPAVQATDRTLRPGSYLDITV